VTEGAAQHHEIQNLLWKSVKLQRCKIRIFDVWIEIQKNWFVESPKACTLLSMLGRTRFLPFYRYVFILTDVYRLSHIIYSVFVTLFSCELLWTVKYIYHLSCSPNPSYGPHSFFCFVLHLIFKKCTEILQFYDWVELVVSSYMCNLCSEIFALSSTVYLFRFSLMWISSCIFDTS
jgi:hypothetical protein